MRFVAVCAAIVLFVFLPAVAQDQARSTMTREGIDKILDVHVSSRPKLPLQDALKAAEEFISSEKIDASHFWLYKANFTLYGDPGKPDKKMPGWYFWWVSDSGQQGNYIEIFVSMDRHCMRLPSM